MIPQARANHYDLLLSNFAISLLGWAGTAYGIFHFRDSFQIHFYHYSTIALLHTFTLLTISPAILGVLYQLLPVVVEGKLGSRSLAWFTSMTWWTGATGFVICRLLGPHLMPAFAGLLFLAILSLILQLLWTIGKGHWSNSAWQVLAASGWLLLMSVSGAFMASGIYPLPALELIQWHAWTGVLGWFSLIIVGLATRLVPMFMLSHGMEERWAIYAGSILVITPVILLPDALIEGKGFAIAGLLFVISGYFSYSIYLIQCIRKRMRRRLEAAMVLFLISFLFPLLALICVWGSLYDLGPAFPSHRMAHAAMILILPGFVGSATLGMSFKILPFMSWMALQPGSKEGRGVPLPQDIGIRWIPSIILCMYPVSVMALTVGIFLHSGTLIGAFGILGSVSLYVVYFLHLLIFVLRRRAI